MLCALIIKVLNVKHSLVSDIKSWPHFIGMVAGSLAGVQQPLQLGHGQDRRHALRVFSVRGPGAAPGPREPGHERHLIWERGRKTHIKNDNVNIINTDSFQPL